MLTNKCIYIYIYILLLTAYTIIIKIDLWLRNNSWTTQTLHLGSWHLLLLSGPSSVTPQTQKPPGNTWERLASRMVCSLTWPSWSFQPFKKTTKSVASPQRDEFPEKSGSFLENMGPKAKASFFCVFVDHFDMTVRWSISINSPIETANSSQSLRVAPRDAQPPLHAASNCRGVRLCFWGTEKQRGSAWNHWKLLYIWVKFWPVYALTINKWKEFKYIISYIINMKYVPYIWKNRHVTHDTYH